MALTQNYPFRFYFIRVIYSNLIEGLVGGNWFHEYIKVQYCISTGNDFSLIRILLDINIVMLLSECINANFSGILLRRSGVTGTLIGLL